VYSLFSKIIKIVATRSNLSKLKCTRSDFGRGTAADPKGELTAISQTFQLDFRREERERKRRGKEGKKGGGVRKKKGKWRGRKMKPPFDVSG